MASKLSEIEELTGATDLQRRQQLLLATRTIITDAISATMQAHARKVKEAHEVSSHRHRDSLAAYTASILLTRLCHHSSYDDAAASLVVPRAIAVRCGVYVFGAAAPLGELGLPLTPPEGRTPPGGEQVPCPRAVLATRGT